MSFEAMFETPKFMDRACHTQHMKGSLTFDFSIGESKGHQGA
jgi:hypothetical protein